MLSSREYHSPVDRRCMISSSICQSGIFSSSIVDINSTSLSLSSPSAAGSPSSVFLTSSAIVA